MRRAPFVLLIVLSFAVQPAGAQVAPSVEAPLAERVPPDALLYLGWCGGDKAQALADGTHARALLDASNLPLLFERTIPTFGAALVKQNADSRPWVKFFTEIFPILYRHPTALAFGGVDWDNAEQPLPRILLVCDAGDEAAMLRNKLAELFAMTRKIELVTLMDVQDGVLYLNIGWQKLDLAMAGDDPTKGLAADVRFTSAMQGLIAQPVSALFIDMPGLIRFAEEGARRDKGEAGVQELQKFLNATGLRGLGSVAATTGFADQLYMTSAFIETRGARTGLLNLLESDPIDEALLGQIPGDAGFAAAGRFDLAKLLTALRNAVLVTNPNGVGDLEQGLKFINMLVGADLENDLLGAMGKTWVAYAAANTGDTALGIVAVNRPIRPQSVESALKNLSLSLVSLVNQSLRQQEKPFRLEGRQVETPHASLFYLDLPLVAPAWSTGGDLVYFGLYPQSVASAFAAAAAEGEASFAHGEGFNAVRRLAGDQAIRGFTYVDLPRYGGRAYTQINAYLQIGSGLLAGFGETNDLPARVPPMLLPPYATFRQHVTPALAVTFVDDRGLHLRLVEPFPFSGILALGMR